MLPEPRADAQAEASAPAAPQVAPSTTGAAAPVEPQERVQEQGTEEERGQSEEGGGGGWWSGWYESAVSKSSQAMDFMKKDLTEFSSAVQSESAFLINSSVLSSGISAVSSTASYLKEAVSSLVQEEEED